MATSNANLIREHVGSFVEDSGISADAAVVLDPPRSGLPEEIILRIAGHGPLNVCLVSCFSETLFRDLAVWKSSGYALREMTALDMFPFTVFLETVSRLEKIS